MPWLGFPDQAVSSSFRNCRRSWLRSELAAELCCTAIATTVVVEPPVSLFKLVAQICECDQRTASTHSDERHGLVKRDDFMLKRALRGSKGSLPFTCATSLLLAFETFLPFCSSAASLSYHGRFSLQIIIVILYSSWSTMADSASCWIWQNEGIWGIQNTTSTWKPCGKTNSPDTVVPCCVDGDMCLDDLICYNPIPSARPAGSSGYYMAGCTDETYTSLYCSKQCTMWLASDVVYVPEHLLWNCCGVENQTFEAPLACANPTNETFAALTPDELQAKGPVTYPLASTSSPSNPISTSSSVQPSKVATSSLSAAAAAGIGFGVALAILLIGGLTLFYWKRGQANKQHPDHAEPQVTGNQVFNGRHEIYGNEKRQSAKEIFNQVRVVPIELAGESLDPYNKPLPKFDPHR